MKKFSVIALILLACFCDSILFQRINLYGIRPDALLCVVVPLGVLLGSAPAGLIGLGVGLLMDICFNKIVGLSAGLYLIAGLAAGSFYRKFYADNPIVPAVTAAIAGAFKELVLCLVIFFSGASVNPLTMLWRYILPSAALTGGGSILVYLILKKAFQSRRKPGFDKSLER